MNRDSEYLWCFPDIPGSLAKVTETNVGTLNWK